MDLFDLFAKITLDDSQYNEGVERATTKGHKLSHALGEGLKKGAKIGIKAVTAAGAAVSTLTGFAVKEFSDYEQLVGGAELMFGDAYKTVSENAKNAYATVQLSQNEYLQQVNGFATGLSTALDGNKQAAAELAHDIVKAEADVIAATGNTKENVQNAFNGIMKSNYTMLDNLQLGITPTKAGFQELIDKVNEWNAANGEATEYQIDNLADAQSALVDYIEMQGLADYASQEALETISGSFAAAKASWSNLVAGMADDNADIDQLMNNFVDSVATAGENILPRVELALQGAAQLISKLFPVIMEQIPSIINNTLPQILDAAVSIITSLVDGLTENKDQIIEATVTVIDTLIDTALDLLPEILQLGTDLLVGLMNSIASHPDEAIHTALEVVTTLVGAILDNLPQLLEAGITMLGELIKGIIDHLPEIIEAGKQLVNKLIEGIKGVFGTIVNVGSQIIDKVKEGISNAWDGLKNWFNGIWDGLFGGRSVDVNVNRTVTNTGNPPLQLHGSHAGGLDYVPFDGYIAELHRGERVLTAKESRSYGAQISGVNININGYNGDPRELAEMISEEMQNMAEGGQAVYA